jgi:signal transduction histidine kinase
VTSTLAGSLPQVLADRDRLHQVFLNLINNSIDAMPNGGSLEVATRLDEQSRAVEITVRDTGTGIPEGGIDCVFEPLWTTKVAGGGFGLAIAREIMIQHGGAIGVDRQTTNGTVFWLRLPLAETAEAAS